jgi:hypothetical protein
MYLNFVKLVNDRFSCVKRRISRKPWPPQQHADIFLNISSNSEISPHELFSIYRDYVKHQYDLINHRAGWYIAFQAFLLAGAIYILQYKVSTLASANPVISGERCNPALVCANLGYMDLMTSLICIIGVGISLMFFCLILAASVPILTMSKLWNRFSEALKPSSTADHWPRLTGGLARKWVYMGVSFTWALPFLVLGFWMVAGWYTEFAPYDDGTSFLRFSSHDFLRKSLLQNESPKPEPPRADVSINELAASLDTGADTDREIERDVQALIIADETILLALSTSRPEALPSHVGPTSHGQRRLPHRK